MKTEHLETCPACGSAAHTPHTKIRDYYYSQETFDIHECGNCGLRFTQNRPGPGEIGRYYDSENYASHDSGSKKSLFLQVYKAARDWMLNRKFELVRQFKPEVRQILDYGTGEGYFTEYLLKKGLDAEGIEPSERARELFTQRTKKQLYPSVETLPAKQFQAITLWHVLEHIHELRPTMQHLVDRLDQHGVLVIAVPNQRSLDCKKFGEAWAAWDVPRHLYHWDSGSLAHFLSTFPLERVYTTHLPLDPFYIGLISARYQKTGPLQGIWTGFQSYLHGRNHREEGSTLLTVWKKK